jgi:nitroreductase
MLREHAADWLGAAASRRSRRAFDGKAAEPRQLEAIAELTQAWRPYSDARVALVTSPVTDVFTGAIGSYGKVTNTPHALVFLAGGRDDFSDQHVGYTGEAIVLEATRLGLATCWVGGFFNPRRVAHIVRLAVGERVLAVSPLGHAQERSTASERAMSRIADARRRLPVSEIAPDSVAGKWPSWAVAAIETARVAPSAMNRQPWRFRMEGKALIVSKDNVLESHKVAKRLDIGIAMLHVDLAAAAHGVDGVWTDLTGMDVARFDPIDSLR